MLANLCLQCPELGGGKILKNVCLGDVRYQVKNEAISILPDFGYSFVSRTLPVMTEDSELFYYVTLNICLLVWYF